MIELGTAVAVFVIAFLIGRGYEKWTSGTMDIESDAYYAGFNDGLDERRP